DYDNDGDVDLFKIRGEDWNDGDPIYFPKSFWRNNGDGTFTNVTVEAGVDESSDPKYSRGVEWADYNDDSWLDIYISNYRQLPNYLYENNGDGTFTDVGSQKGVADGPPYGEGGNLDPYNRGGHSVGSVWGDYDNDGYLDLWVTNLNHKDARTSDDSLLYHNDGPPDYTFTNMRGPSGIPVKPYVFPNEGDELFVGCAWADYDNDGDLDLYLPQIYDIDYAYSFLYMNNGDGTFTDVTQEAAVRVWDTYAGCWCDYDNDGDQDLITSGRDSGGDAAPHFVHLFKNVGIPGNWLQIELEGDGVYSNRAAIGARVTVTTENGDIQIREVEGGMGCHGMQNSLILEFGFGFYTGTVDIEIRWPQNKVQFLEDVSINQKINILDESTGDLVITDMSFDNTHPIMGEVVRIDAIVKNIGLTLINSAEVKFYLDSISGMTQILPTQTLNDIYPDEEQAAFVDFNTDTISGSHTIYTTVDIIDPPPSGTTNILSKNMYIRTENALPIAVLSANPTVIEKGGSVFFDAADSTDDTTIIEYYFDYGDGNNSDWVTEDTITFQYEFGGDYTASLTVRDDDGGESQNIAEILIEVKAKPQAVLSANLTSIFKGQSITLNGSDSYDEDGTIAEYYFDFGDGEYTGWITDSFVSHQYSEYGDYTAFLMVEDDEGQTCENPSEVTIEVRAKPYAILFADTTIIYAGQTVLFNGSQSYDEDGTVVEYDYDFGDGSSSGWNPHSEIPHSYTSPGQYLASLTVRDDDGDESENPAEVTIYVRAVPTAVLSAAPTTIYKGESVLFDASLSTDEGGTIVEYYFDYGDNYFSGWISSPTRTHFYNTGGYYTAYLTVMDNDDDVSVNLAEVVIQVKAKPTADLSVSSITIYKGENITFNASQSTDEGGTILSYYFNFGDGQNSSWIQTPNATHQYDTPGEYTAYLRVMDDDGDISENLVEVVIEVKAKPKAVLSASSTVTYKGEAVTFNATGSSDEDGFVSEYYFDFGDGHYTGWTTDSQTTHVYTLLGTYDVYLIVKDDDEDICEIAAKVIIQVRARPTAILIANETKVFEEESVTFDASKSRDKDGTIEEYYFDFGDGENTGWISEAVVTHVYLLSDTYSVSLMVKDNDSEISTNKAVVRVYVNVPNSRPTAVIDLISPKPATAGYDVSFTGHGEDEDGSIISYLWRSNIDGELSNAQSFSTSLSWGTHVIYFKAQDDDEDWSEEVSEVLYVKEFNEKPVLFVKFPQDNNRVEGMIIISGNAEDPDGDIQGIEISIDGGSWEEIEAKDFWSYELDTSDLSDGEHMVLVKAYDGEDYSEVEYITIIVGEEEEEEQFEVWYILLALVIVIAIVVLAIVTKGPSKKKGINKRPSQIAEQSREDGSQKETPGTRMNL
ncbi:MAG: PKD domain-containing protein, partial [Methanomassiliicoccales archaeon]